MSPGNALAIIFSQACQHPGKKNVLLSGTMYECPHFVFFFSDNEIVNNLKNMPLKMLTACVSLLSSFILNESLINQSLTRLRTFSESSLDF